MKTIPRMASGLGVDINKANRVFVQTAVGGFVKVGKKACREYVDRMDEGKVILTQLNPANNDLYIS